MSATRDPRRPRTGSNYYYRRRIGGWELLPAIGIGIGAGVAAFYVARLLLQRTPIAPESRRVVAGRKLDRDVRVG
jgi:hypothetical protein